MTARPGRYLRRNAVVVAGTAALVAALFVYPTSTNRTNGSPAVAARPGIVSGESSSGTGARVVVVNGQPVETGYGPVQIQVTIRGSRITAITVLTAPSAGGRDRAISAFALPRLEAAAIAAQSSRIDTVSGATYTSAGYRRSLQSALDAAHVRPSAK